MTVGFLQTSPVFGDKEENLRQAEALARGIRADLLVLPELFTTGYTFVSADEAASLSETADGRTAQFLRRLSVDTGAAIVAGFAERHNGKIYNSAMIVNQGQVIGLYRKIHLFNKEKLWFSQGDLPLTVFELNGMKVGVMICFDWIFPETMRTLALRGAQVVAHPSNLVMPYCQNAMVTRCLENRVFAVTANRIGRETRGDDDFQFTGHSQITGTGGQILLSGPGDQASAGIIEIDIQLADNKLINPYNHLLDDRRPEWYE